LEHKRTSPIRVYPLATILEAIMLPTRRVALLLPALGRSFGVVLR